MSINILAIKLELTVNLKYRLLNITMHNILGLNLIVDLIGFSIATLKPVSFFPLRKWIESGVIVEGTKLITFGSEIQNLEKPCGPLELPSLVDEIDRILSDEEGSTNDMSESSQDDQEEGGKSPTKKCKTEEDFKCAFIKLHANSTRRARW